ncbi:MAG: DNA-formamidopyrimidine glycosylase family protein [Patescibacteria group bacterium]|jgi:formamidopyrimidine-DNA glycosylase
MPELPDLTVFAENLAARYNNRTISRVQVVREKPILPITQADFIKRLEGKKITAVRRHGKQLVFSLDTQEELWVHLMLHGDMYALQGTDPLPGSACISLSFDNGSMLCFADRTTWMKMSIIPVSGNPPSWASAGVDPLSDVFNRELLEGVLKKKRRTVLKPLLMDQKLIGGIGNAFADEILWKAGILPQRTAGTLSADEISELHRAIRDVLQDAIRNIRTQGGKKITGEIRGFLIVHGKEQGTCPRCASQLQFSLLNTRGTWHCPSCQR